MSNIRLAEQMIKSGQGSAAEEVLMRQRPGPGDEDLREFAWQHLLGRCHTERRTLTGHRGQVYHVEFSPGGDLLASAGKDGMVLIWDTNTWQLARSIRPSGTEVNCATFSPDGKTLATVDDDGKLRLWEIATGQCQLEKPAHKGDAMIASFTPDGKRVITGGRTDGFVRIWDCSTGAMLDSLNGYGFVLSPDGTTLAILGAGGESTLYNFATRSPIGSLPRTPGIQNAAFSHDGTKLATAHEEGRVVRLWDVAKRRLLREFPGHTEGVFSVAFSPDDQTITSGGGDRTIRFWDAATGTLRGIHQGHTGRVWSLSLSPDGHTIASAGGDGTVKLWDAELPRDHLQLPAPIAVRIAFSPDGRDLTALEYGPPWHISRWDTHSGRLLRRNPLDPTYGPYAGAFSDDGQWLASRTNEGGVTLYNAATGRLQSVFDQTVDFVNYVTFSPEGRYLLLHLAGGRSRFGTSRTDE